MPHIYLLPIEPVDYNAVDSIRRHIFDKYRLKTRDDHRRLEVGPAYDSVRNQYNTSTLLQKVIADPPEDAYRILAVTNVDLFLPIFTFQFGQAQLNGLGGIFSTHRLHNDFYGLPHDDGIYMDRVIKEAIHELGHTFGLVHCYDPFCVMRSSTYVEDVDQKTSEFCTSCRRKFLESLKVLR